MKVRIRFTKQGDMRFIGHLDFMRFFQKVIRRAGLDIRFSEGISPHMIMSFASPLGVGVTSEGDYVDIELNTPVSGERALKALNENSVPDVRFLDFRQVEEGKAGKAMSLVAAADYLIGFREGCEPLPGWSQRFLTFLEQEEITVTRTKKKAVKKADGKRKHRLKKEDGAQKGEEQASAAAKDAQDALPQSEDLQENGQVTETLDIRPLIYRAQAVTLDGKEQVKLRLSSGSAANLRPELVMEAFAAAQGYEADPFALRIHRLDLLARAGKQEESAKPQRQPESQMPPQSRSEGSECGFISLSALGKPVMTGEGGAD